MKQNIYSKPLLVEVKMETESDLMQTISGNSDPGSSINNPFPGVS